MSPGIRPLVPLAEGSEPSWETGRWHRVATRGTLVEMADPTDLEEAAGRVARHLRLPFQVYSVGAQERSLHVEVPADEVPAAVAWFDAHAVELADGTHASVRVEGRQAGGWVTFPVPRSDPHRAAPEQADEPVERYVGLPVEEAAALANAAGWLVRAYEPHAVLTLDRRMNRMNLRYGADGIETAAHIG